MAPALRMINGVPDLRPPRWYHAQWVKIAGFMIGGSTAVSGVALVAMKGAAVAILNAGGIALKADVDAQFKALRAAEDASFTVTTGKLKAISDALDGQAAAVSATANEVQFIKRRIKRLPIERREP